MKNQIASLATLLVLTLPVGAAHAQSADAAYCQALTDKYTTYVADQNEHRPAPANVGVTAAIAQCGEGNTAAGIPALERALTDAGVALPSRG
jgi:hypothetical protein